MWSLSKNSDFVIAQLDWAIQNILKRLDSRFRENDDFLWKWQFLDKLCVPIVTFWIPAYAGMTLSLHPLPPRGGEITGKSPLPLWPWLVEERDG